MGRKIRKGTDRADTFRIGNIGEIYREDIEKLLDIIGSFLEQQEKKMQIA